MADEMRQLATDVAKAAGRLARLEDVDAVVKKGAQVMKDAYNDEAKGSWFSGSVAGSWTYDRQAAVGAVEYELGPDKDRGGALANIYYFGGSNGGGGTGDIDGPAHREMPEIEKQLADIIEDIL